MSRFLSSALRAIFEDGLTHKSIVESIASSARYVPVVLLEIRDVQSDSSGRPVYRWEASFSSKKELLRFDEAVRAACETVAKEEE